MPCVFLDWILDQKKWMITKGIIGITGKVLNTKYILSNSMVSVLIFLNLIIVLRLCKEMSLLTEVTCSSSDGWHYLGHDICDLLSNG